MQSVAVVGAGAIGGSISVDLVRSGIDVMIIDQWPAHVEAVRREGLRVSTGDRSELVRVKALHLCDVATLRDPFDIILLAVKAYDTRWACELVKSRLKSDGVIVGVQNGMTAADVANVFGEKRTVGCVIGMAAELEGPGVVRRHTDRQKTWFGLGAIGGLSDAHIAGISHLFQYVGQVDLSSDILAAKWMKVVVNAVFMGFLATLGLPLREAAALPGAREIMLRIGTEALHVGQGLGYQAQPIFGIKPEEFAGSNRALDLVFDKLLEDVGPYARPAVLQDHLKGRFSEVDAINGVIVTQGGRVEVATPGNAMIVEVSHRIFSKQLAPDPKNIEIFEALLGG